MMLNRIITLSDGKKIAEFDNEYETAYFNFLTKKYEWSSKFVLDKHNLKIRIENLKKQNTDTSVEESALFLLTE